MIKNNVLPYPLNAQGSPTKSSQNLFLFSSFILCTLDMSRPYLVGGLVPGLELGLLELEPDSLEDCR